MNEIENSQTSFQFPKRAKWLQSQTSGLKLIHFENTARHTFGFSKANKTRRMPREIKLPHFGLTQDIKNLENLTDGWLEGAGKAPDLHFLKWIEQVVIEAFPSIEYPVVAPTEEGHVVFEWIRPKVRIELEFIPDGSMELYSTDLDQGTFVEESFKKGEWGNAFDKVKELLEA